MKAMSSGSPVQAAARAREIFLDALDLPDATARAGFVATACGHDSALRRRVELMLSDHLTQDGFMAAPAAADLPEVESRDQIGGRIGRYKLLEKLGEGGMGVVYLAKQEDPVRRQVALKLIKAGMDTRQVVARFEAERQALALMDHPNIARVLDGGTTEAPGAPASVPASTPQNTYTPARMPALPGRPYFVMELVRGPRITDYVRDHTLPLAARLELFLQVCSAVQHAHQKGIIHRDLKPSNILVTEVDGKPVPKVIDFGVAKALHGKLTEKTVHTQLATLIGTPAYMSPEQAEMTSADIDTRSDIYSLGALLYELLAGSPPFSEERLRTAGYAEMQRIIREEEPERRSKRLRQSTVAAPRKSAADSSGLGSGDPERSPDVQDNSGALTRRRYRQADSPRNSQLKPLSTDLDWIVMKCLEKDRSRRYETASALAADIQRHLRNEPVTARPPSAIYRLQKAVRRNKIAFAAALAVILSLLGGMAATSWQAIRANRAEKAQARQTLLAENRLKTTLAFTDHLFRDVARQLWQISGTAPLSEMLATNGMAFLQELQGDAELTADFRANLAQLYVQLAQSRAWPHGNTTADYAMGFKMATNAIHLLQSVGLEKLTPASIRALSRAELIAGQAAERTFRFDEALAHARRAEALVTRLTNNSTFGSEALTLQVAIPGGVTGSMLLRTGRPEDALTNCCLPFLRAMQARGLDESRSSVFDVAHLHAAHQCVGEALAAVGRYSEAVPHFQEATRLMEILVQRTPNAAEFASTLPVVSAKLSEALLATGDSRDLETFQRANQAASELITRDRRNAGFQETEVEVLRLTARGLTHWAAAPGIPPEVRRSRLAEARDYLHRAEQRLGNLTSDQLRRWLSVEFEKARVFLESAEQRWGSEKESSLNQEHGSPRPAPP